VKALEQHVVKSVERRLTYASRSARIHRAPLRDLNVSLRGTANAWTWKQDSLILAMKY